MAAAVAAGGGWWASRQSVSVRLRGRMIEAFRVGAGRKKQASASGSVQALPTPLQAPVAHLQAQTMALVDPIGEAGLSEPKRSTILKHSLAGTSCMSRHVHRFGPASLLGSTAQATAHWRQGHRGL